MRRCRDCGSWACDCDQMEKRPEEDEEDEEREEEERDPCAPVTEIISECRLTLRTPLGVGDEVVTTGSVADRELVTALHRCSVALRRCQDAQARARAHTGALGFRVWVRGSK